MKIGDRVCLSVMLRVLRSEVAVKPLPIQQLKKYVSSLVKTEVQSGNRTDCYKNETFVYSWVRT
jgi:hypothetical protein